MKLRKLKTSRFCVIWGIGYMGLLLSCNQKQDSNHYLTSLPDLQKAINSANAGDIIILKDGAYDGEEPVIINRQGTPSMPIIIKAETIGGAEIKGKNGFLFDSLANYVTISGFRFTHAQGVAKVSVGANHCTLTQNIYECAPAGPGNKAYLYIAGDDTEISYNTFQNKNTEGCMITIQGPGRDGMAQRTWIHHNLFDNFENSGENNSSAIQPGLSSRSLTPAHTLIEQNLFLDCRGENEGIVANKSSDNIYRYNTFGPGCREVSIRHGDRMEVYSNFFIGSSGLRFSGDDHKIYSNYFEDCDFAINCTNGDGDVHAGDDLRQHDRPDRVEIVNNTLVNNKTNYRMPNRNNGLGATQITFANNVIQGGEAISIDGSYTDPVWAGNVLWNVPDGDIPAEGFTKTDPKLTKDENNIYRPGKESSIINAGTDYAYVTLDMDGQARDQQADLGADEFSDSPITNRPLTGNDVGPAAKQD